MGWDDPLKQVGNIVLDWMEQKQLTPRDVDEGLRKMWSAYRTTKQMAAQVNDVFGENSALKARAAVKTFQWLRSITRRYNEQIGVQHNRTKFQP